MILHKSRASVVSALALYLFQEEFMKKEIKVVMVEPSKHPTITTINNDLESLQKAVGGLIEFVGLEENTCILYVD